MVYRIHTRQGREKWVRDFGRVVYDPGRNLILLEGFILDISDHKRVELQLQMQTQRLQALHTLDMVINADSDLHATFDVLLDQIVTHLKADAVDLLLYNPATQLLEFAGGRGFCTDALRYTHLHLGESFAGEAARARRIIHVADLPHYIGDFERSPKLLKEKFKIYVGVPLIAKGQLRGVLEIFHRVNLEVDEHWFDFLESLAGQAAIALDNATLLSELQHSNTELALAYDATLEGWVKAMELHSQETAGHSQRVAKMTLELAKTLGIQANGFRDIWRGALLHDIGKMGIPDAILLKPGPLTTDEMLVMKLHPVYAQQWLFPIAYLRPSLHIPYAHHEKWNGSGYPRGLEADQIPLEARIFTVVDVWDSLTSDRAYRSAWPAEQAADYIRANAGIQFDPQVVASFFDTFNPPQKLIG